jgi:uncharacterized protein
MLVNIDEIKENGLRREWDLTREELDEFVKGDAAGYRARKPLHVEAFLRKLDPRVMVKAGARAALLAPCGRCLSPVEMEVPVDFEITFVRAERAPAEERNVRRQPVRGRVAGSFEPESVDEERYSGKVIDLRPAVREQLLLALPSYPVCQEGCRGLCPVCGTNLNEKSCGCDRRVPDPRWAGLEKFKAKAKEE